MDEVARQCGFSTAAALRPHFRRVFGVAPGTYRETFAGDRAAGGWTEESLGRDPIAVE
jgi:transcriptional regulator GlxA family with amidase domain